MLVRLVAWPQVRTSERSERSSECLFVWAFDRMSACAFVRPIGRVSTRLNGCVDVGRSEGRCERSIDGSLARLSFRNDR